MDRIDRVTVTPPRKHSPGYRETQMRSPNGVKDFCGINQRQLVCAVCRTPRPFLTTITGVRGGIRRETVGPSVYGRFDGLDWPWLPRWNGPWEGMLLLCAQYISCMKGTRVVALAYLLTAL